ncbi:LysR family transcriptional regulator [Sphingomonas sp. BK580]|uniref:LysR family transcriptional regulator n=1 Tax=Sphingomonas sp. BK580 TaxID=2586972 RepID=UPI001617B0DE|nr:LysR family transcriptional regulator [Sphingomonas sp. BK580]MBB3695154.1 DNA-binding transcriptional LysR family regulator [Sphingomonas sp. BK580]
MRNDVLRRLDADLLLTLDALLAESNVTRAAQRLGVQQSALSARLARLRAIFADRLFVPSADGRGVSPTPRALDLAPTLSQVLGLLDAMVEPASDFDPATSRRTFVVALHEIPAVMLGPELAPLLAASAPLARLAMIAPDPASLAERLEQGSIDVVVGTGEQAREGWLARSLFKDAFVTAQRRGHPRGGGALDLDAFAASEHVLVSADGGGFFGQVDARLAALGLERRVALSVQTYSLAPTIVAASDLLCTLPSRFLHRFRDVLDLFDPPLDLPPAELAAYWHPRVQEDAGHRWFRGLLFAAAGATAKE